MVDTPELDPEENDNTPTEEESDSDEELPGLEGGSDNEDEEEEVRALSNADTSKLGAADGQSAVTYPLYKHLVELLQTPEKLELMEVRSIRKDSQLQLRIRCYVQGWRKGWMSWWTQEHRPAW